MAAIMPASLAALYRKVPIRHVLRRNGGLVSFHGGSLLLHLEVAEHRHQHHENDDSQTRSDDQTQSPGEDGLHIQSTVWKTAESAMDTALGAQRADLFALTVW